MDDKEKKMIILSVEDNLFKLKEVFDENRININRDLTTIFKNNLRLEEDEEVELVEKVTRNNLFPNIIRNINSLEDELVSGIAIQLSIMDKKVSLDPSNEERIQGAAKNYIMNLAEKSNLKLFKDITSNFINSFDNEMIDKITYLKRFDKSKDFYKIKDIIEDQMSHYLNVFFGSVYDYANRLVEASTMLMLEELKKNKVEETIPEQINNEIDSKRMINPFIFNKIATLFNCEITARNGINCIVDLDSNEDFEIVVDETGVYSPDNLTPMSITFNGDNWTFRDKNGISITKYPDGSFLINNKFGVTNDGDKYEYVYKGIITDNGNVKTRINNVMNMYPKFLNDVCRNEGIKDLFSSNMKEKTTKEEIKTYEETKKDEFEEVEEIKFDKIDDIEQEFNRVNEIEPTEDASTIKKEQEELTGIEFIDDAVIDKRLSELYKTPEVQEFLNLLSSKGVSFENQIEDVEVTKIK